MSKGGRSFSVQWVFSAALLSPLGGCSVYDDALIQEGQDVSSVPSGGATSAGAGGLTEALGGAPGAGGSRNSDGGSFATGGEASTGSGGKGGETAGTGGEPPTELVQFPFTSSLEGFFVSFENTTGGFSSTAAWDEDEGEPDAGSASLEISTAGADESISFTRVLGAPLDLSGAELTAQVRLDSGLSENPLCPGGAYVIAKSGESFVFARGEWRNLLSADGWVSITMNLDAPDWESEGFDPSDVREIGVGIATGGPSCAMPDWQTARVHVDSIDY